MRPCIGILYLDSALKLFDSLMFESLQEHRNRFCWFVRDNPESSGFDVELDSVTVAFLIFFRFIN